MSAAVMTPPIAETSPLSTAKIAGVFYLISVLSAGAAALVRWRLFLPGDAAATHILSHQPSFWMVFAADLISASCYFAATLLFYEMFKGVSKRLSWLMALFSFLGCAIAAFASLFHVASFVVLRGAQYLNILGFEPLRSLARLCLTLRAQTYNISLIFLGVSCLLIACVISSRPSCVKLSASSTVG